MANERNEKTSTHDCATSAQPDSPMPARLSAAFRTVDCEDLRVVFARSATLARAYYRSSAAGDQLLGLGVAASARAGEQDSIAARFGALRDALSASDALAHHDKIRLLGWSAFDPEYTRDPASSWSGYARREIYLPEILLRRKDGKTSALIIGEADQLDAIWHRWKTLIAAATRDHRSGRLGFTTTQFAEHHWLDRDTFCHGVERVTKDRVAPKVVLARRVRLNMAEAIDLRAALEILSESYPTCTRFAISSPENEQYPVFFGATPERLAQVKDGEVHTMALAGTAKANEGDALLNKPKELEEHQFVVDMILDSLAPYCSELTSDPTPKLKRLTNVSHLLSDISGRLKPGVGLAEVVDALHSTPAVCGTPRTLARELIAQFEDFDRGLYAGTFAWMDLEGNGEFDVALRCALAGDTQALLFAGAGITRDSDIDLEWTETRAKFEPLLRALAAMVLG